MSIGGATRSNSFFAAGARVAVRTMLMLPIILLTVCYFVASIAEAHGGGPGLGYDPCIQRAGTNDFIHLAAYQPTFNPFAEYCGVLPQAGRTLLVFDLIGAELADARVSLDVIQDGGRFQLSMPPRRFRSGVADLSAELPAGTYTVLVSIEELDGRHRLTFPLVVGAWWDRLLVPVVVVLLIGLVTAVYCVFQIRGVASERSSSLVKMPAERRRV